MRHLLLAILLICLPALALADCWQSRFAIPVTAGSQLINYALPLYFGAAHSAIFDSSQADRDDWRFRNADGDLLPYWFAYAPVDTDSAVIYVKIDTLASGTNYVYLYTGCDTATSVSDGESTFLLWQGFDTDFTVSGVTDILHMDGMGVDSFVHIVTDTSRVGGRVSCREGSNLISLSDTALYLRISCCCSTCTSDYAEYMWLWASPDAFTWTMKGRLDTLGGNPADTNARGQDAYLIQWQDTLWNYYEDKRYHAAYPGKDIIGLWYSPDSGDSWSPYGPVDAIGQEYVDYLDNNWLYGSGTGAGATNCGSPTAIIVGDTIWLALEGPGKTGDGMEFLWSLHPKGPFHKREMFRTCWDSLNHVARGYWYQSCVPDQMFAVNDTIYMDCHARTATSPWLHTRYRIPATFDTLLDTRIFSTDSMLFAGTIFMQDTLRDSTWIAIESAPVGGVSVNIGAAVRWRTMLTDPSAAPNGWSGFKKFSTFGFNEARNGVLTLAAEPFREDSNNSAVGLRSDIGFDSNFVLEYRQKLKWDTLSPPAVVSFGSGNPAPYDGVAFHSYHTATDDGYFIRYGRSPDTCSMGRKRADSTQGGYTPYFAIPDSLLNSWRVHHLAFGPYDTLRFWMDGLTSSSAHKKKDARFTVNTKRIQFASGEAKNKTYVPRGSQMLVDWALVRPYVYPEPTYSIATTVENADSNYVYFDTILVTDADATIRTQSTRVTINRGISTACSSGISSTDAMFFMLHWPLPIYSSPDTVVTVTSALCSAYAYDWTTDSSFSLSKINDDWIEGNQNGAAADSSDCCWNWRGRTKLDTLSVCGNTIPAANIAWSAARFGTTIYDTVKNIKTKGWLVFDNILPLVQGQFDAGPDSAFGTVLRKTPGIGNGDKNFYTREWVEPAPPDSSPRLRVVGYYRTLIVPDPVASVTASDDACDSVLITWSNVADEDSFQVRRNGSRIGMTLSDVLTYTNASGVVGTRYKYEVAAYNADSCYATTASDSGGAFCGSNSQLISISGE